MTCFSIFSSSWGMARSGLESPLRAARRVSTMASRNCVPLNAAVISTGFIACSLTIAVAPWNDSLVLSGQRGFRRQLRQTLRPRPDRKTLLSHQCSFRLEAANQNRHGNLLFGLKLGIGVGEDEHFDRPSKVFQCRLRVKVAFLGLQHAKVGDDSSGAQVLVFPCG